MGMEEEFSIGLMRIVALGAGAGSELSAGFDLEYVFGLMAIKTQFASAFYEQEFELGLMGFVTEVTLPVLDRGMGVFGFHQKGFVAPGAEVRHIAF